MAVVGVILSARDGLVIAADTPNGASGASNDTILQVGNQTGCYLYSPQARPVLQSFLAATQPVPPSPGGIAQSLAQYLGANPPAEHVGFALVGLEPPTHSNTVQEVTWTEQAARQTPFPGNLMVGAHSVGRYLNDRMYGFNASLELAKAQAAFLIAETRNALPNVRPYLVIATVDRVNGFQWVPDHVLDQLLDQAFERARRLRLNCVELF